MTVTRKNTITVIQVDPNSEKYVYLRLRTSVFRSTLCVMPLKLSQKVCKFRAEAYTKVNIHIISHRVMAPFSLVNGYKSFEGIYCLHLQLPKTKVIYSIILFYHKYTSLHITHIWAFLLPDYATWQVNVFRTTWLCKHYCFLKRLACEEDFCTACLTWKVLYNLHTSRNDSNFKAKISLSLCTPWNHTEGVEV